MTKTVYHIRSEAVDWLDIENQVVALDGARSLYLGTNETGRLLWLALVEGATIDQMVEKLLTTYEIDEDTARADVSAYLEMLATHGLLASE